MVKNRYWLAFNLALISLASLILNPQASHSRPKDTGGKGAQIYCYMRETGNKHEVSWNAAYALIKRQSNSIFKTSPKHAAVMIIESVVEEPNDYPDCGRYLGELFGGKIVEDEMTKSSGKSSGENRYNF